MKAVFALTVFALVVTCQGSFRQRDERVSMALLARDYDTKIHSGLQLWLFQKRVKANFNDYVDRLLKHAADFMVENGLDPMELPEITKTFEFKDLVGILWHGELDLRRGWVQDLSTIFRSGDVTVEYKDKKMLIKAEMAFKDLAFNYDFEAKFMKLSKKGDLVGRSDDVKVFFSALVDLEQKTIQLEDLNIVHVGDVDIKFEGLGVVGDFIVDAMSKVILTLFKGPIISAVETEVRKAVDDALANIDIGDIIGDIMNRRH